MFSKTYNTCRKTVIAPFQNLIDHALDGMFHFGELKNSFTSPRQRFVEHLRVFSFWINTDDLFQRSIVALEDQHTRNRRDVILHCQFRVFINIAFADFDFAFISVRYLIDGRSQRSAWPTPRCPKIHQYRLATLNELLKVLSGNIDHVLASHVRFLVRHAGPAVILVTVPDRTNPALTMSAIEMPRSAVWIHGLKLNCRIPTNDM